MDTKGTAVSIVSKVEEDEEDNDWNDSDDYDNGDDDDDENDDDDDDKVVEYWGSDHHKFEWSGYMQSLDPRSWHALGLGVPESFLSKGQYRVLYISQDIILAVLFLGQDMTWRSCRDRCLYKPLENNWSSQCCFSVRTLFKHKAAGTDLCNVPLAVATWCATNKVIILSTG